MEKSYWSLCFAMLVLFSYTLFAQDDEEFKKWSKDQDKQYQEYLSKEDQQFLDYMAKEWKEYQASQGLKLFDKPEPKTQPFVSNPIKKEEPKFIPPKLEEPKTIAPQEKMPIEPSTQPVIEQPKGPELSNTSFVLLNYFEVPIVLDIPPALKNYQMSGNIDKEAVRSFYEACSKIDCDKMLMEIRQKEKEMKVGDRGTAVLADQVGHKVFAGKENQARLLTWYLLLRLGFDAKVGYTKNNNVYLLFPSRQHLYALQYYSLPPSNNRYYVFPVNNQSTQMGEGVFTYEGSHPQATASLDFVIHKTPVFKEKIGERLLCFTYNDVEYKIPVQYNADAVEYVLNYPQVDFEAYFDSAPSREAAKSLQDALQPYLKGRTEEDRVNFLLRFVQTAFQYKIDEEIFGKEKPLFPDETIYYPYSNCKDRAFLFAYLVRSLLHLDVVGLHYPNHVATAVQFNKKYEGDTIDYAGNVYTICDPTYINANLGMCMPQFKGVKPDVIAIQ